MILLIAETPVAGTVARLAKWIGRLACQDCRALIKQNYTHNAFRLPEGAFGKLPDWERAISIQIRKARIIFAHNICDPNLMELIFATKLSSTPIIYQYHSPPNEPPQYSYPILNQYQFDAVLAVAQGYGRFISGSIPVPNIIPDFKIPYFIPKSNVIFAPHMRSTNFRWSSKITDENIKQFKIFSNHLGGFKFQTAAEVFGKVVTHEEVLLYLQTVPVLLDDINTGLIHQTAFEALKARCVVFSAADLYALEEYAGAIQAPPPSLIHVNGADEVIERVSDPLFKKQFSTLARISEEYAATYLGEERLANYYFNIISPFIENA